MRRLTRYRFGPPPCTHRKLRATLRLLSRGTPLTLACERTHLSKQTFYHWSRRAIHGDPHLHWLLSLLHQSILHPPHCFLCNSPVYLRLQEFRYTEPDHDSPTVLCSESCVQQWFPPLAQTI